MLIHQTITGVYIPTCVWTNIEVHIGIVTASVPAFWPLLRALATGSVCRVTDRTHAAGSSGPSDMTPNTRTIPSFLTRSRRGNTHNNTTFRDDEEGFVYLKDIVSASPATSSRCGHGDADVERGSTEERERGGGGKVVAMPGVVEKAGRGGNARIQIQKDWTVSTESYVGMDSHERSFLK
jgi:hypothetical protein